MREREGREGDLNKIIIIIINKILDSSKKKYTCTYIILEKRVRETRKKSFTRCNPIFTDK